LHRRSPIEKLDGRGAAKSWLEGFAANAKHYNDNEGIIAAVDSGQIGAGIVNHYYWFEAIAEEGKDKVPSKLHYFGHEDPGALVNVSGAGALSSSDNPELAQEFLAYIVSKEGQNAMTHSGDWEYPLNSAVSAPPGVKPFGSLEPPKVTPADLGDGSAPLELMQEVGLL
jgi:iron(III) transport system substrate-binding protein